MIRIAEELNQLVTRAWFGEREAKRWNWTSLQMLTLGAEEEFLYLKPKDEIAYFLGVKSKHFFDLVKEQNMVIFNGNRQLCWV